MAFPEELRPGDKPFAGLERARRFSTLLAGPDSWPWWNGVVGWLGTTNWKRDVALEFLPDLVVHDLAVLDEWKPETRRSLQLHSSQHRAHPWTSCRTRKAPVFRWSTSMVRRYRRCGSNSRTGSLRAEELLPWVDQICEGLQHAHEHARIVHRDIKPANLLLNSRRDFQRSRISESRGA